MPQQTRSFCWIVCGLLGTIDWFNFNRWCPPPFFVRSCHSNFSPLPPPERNVQQLTPKEEVEGALIRIIRLIGNLSINREVDTSPRIPFIKFSKGSFKVKLPPKMMMDDKMGEKMMEQFLRWWWGGWRMCSRVSSKFQDLSNAWLGSVFFSPRTSFTRVN